MGTGFSPFIIGAIKHDRAIASSVHNFGSFYGRDLIIRVLAEFLFGISLADPDRLQRDRRIYRACVEQVAHDLEPVLLGCLSVRYSGPSRS